MENILDLIKPYKTLSIIGMDKNVGKTTLLNFILKETRGKISLGLTSIGRDGEEEDRVTATEKPSIYIEKGTYLATAKVCLSNSDITREIIRTTGINSPMGEIIEVRALSDGYVELGGPSVNSEMALVCKDLKELGCDIVIVDGALGRRTTASPSITEGTILCTGASLHQNMYKVVEETVKIVNLLSIEKEEKIEICSIVEEIFRTSRVGIIDKFNNYKKLEVKTSLEASQDILANLNEESRFIAIKGILSDKLIDNIMKCTNLYKNCIIIVEDGTKIFLNNLTLSKFQKQGGRIRALNKINLVGVSCNPKSPLGYEFPGNAFLKELRAHLNIPVFDVVGGG